MRDNLPIGDKWVGRDCFYTDAPADLRCTGCDDVMRGRATTPIPNDLTRLYFEAHLTVEATALSFDYFRKRFSDDEWSVSQFSDDDVDGIAGKWFITAKSASRANIISMVKDKYSELSDRGYVVLRWKIEETVFDSKHGDKLSDAK